MGLIFGGGIKAVTGLVGGWLGGLAMTGILAVIGFALSGTGVGAAVAALPILIIGIIALFCIFKLFLSLVYCYAGIIISIIAGPLQIVLGVLPGSQGGFSSWFKDLMVNILVFPVVALALLIGWLLTGSHGPTWAPPVIAPSGGGLSGLIGFAVLLLLPKIPDMIKNAFKMKPAGYGTAIGETVFLKQISGTAKAIGSQEIGYQVTSGGSEFINRLIPNERIREGLGRAFGYKPTRR